MNTYRSLMETLGRRFKSEWHEEDHPRAEDGKFTDGGSAGSSDSEGSGTESGTGGKDDSPQGRRDRASDTVTDFQKVVSGVASDEINAVADLKYTPADDSEGARAAIDKVVSGYSGAARKAADSIDGLAGAEGYAAKVRKMADRFEAASGRFRDRITSGADKLEKARETLMKHRETEPDEANMPQPPKDSDYPDPPNPDDYPGGDEDAKYERDMEKHEAKVEKIDAKYAADLDRWSAQQDRWQEKFDKLEAAVVTHEDAITEAAEELNEIIDAFPGDVEALLADAEADVHSRADEEEDGR